MKITSLFQRQTRGDWGGHPSVKIQKPSRRRRKPRKTGEKARGDKGL